MALGLPAAYLAVLVLIGISYIPRKGLLVASMIPVAMATMHFAYAVGIIYGMWSAVFNRRAWDIYGHMTRLSR